MSGATSAAIIGGGMALSAGASMMGSNAAADAQTSAANSANAVQMAMFNKTQQNLQPYMDLGQQGITGLTNNLTDLTSPVTMDQATLEQTPGYQFNLQQGLKSTENSATARGLGVSGAAQKGAAAYATGLADSTYQNQFNNAVTNQTNTFNRLMGLTNIGQASAAGVSSAGQQTASNIGSNTIGAGNAQAANYLNMGNSVGGLANNAGSAYMLNNLTSGKSLFGGTTR